MSPLFEAVDKLIDKYFLGSGTRSIRPENEVAKLIGDGAYILDVRMAFEAKKGIAPGATNISLFQLNRRLGELPRDRTIVTYCMTGGRAGKARDILERNGFKVFNGGGYETIRKIVMKSQSTAA
jgi:rhodanese-related sulfurtransferase